MCGCIRLIAVLMSIFDVEANYFRNPIAISNGFLRLHLSRRHNFAIDVRHDDHVGCAVLELQRICEKPYQSEYVGSFKLWSSMQNSPTCCCWAELHSSLPFIIVFFRDVPVIHPVPGKCRISHYSVLPGPGKIMGPSNYFLNFITVSKKSYGNSR